MAYKSRADDKAWRKRNAKKLRKAKRLWYLQNRRLTIERSRDWRKANSKRDLKNKRNWDKKHPEYKKKWNKDHPENKKAAWHRREAKKKSNGGSFTAVQWSALCEKYNHKCLCCNKKKSLTADHVIPVSKGGSSRITNIQPLCKSCNSKKGTKTTDYREGCSPTPTT